MTDRDTAGLGPRLGGCSSSPVDRVVGSTVDPLGDTSLSHLRSIDLPGFALPQQVRTLEATRDILRATWAAMTESPETPPELAAVLARAGVSPSTFYSRFRGIEGPITLLGLLWLEAEPSAGSAVSTMEEEWPGEEPCPRLVVLDRVTRAATLSVSTPSWSPRSFQVYGQWSDQYVAARRQWSHRRVRDLAAVAEATGTSESEAPLSQPRLLSWLALVSTASDQAALVEAVGLADRPTRESYATATTVLGELLFAPTPDVWDVARALPENTMTPTPMRPLLGLSDRKSKTISDFRQATRTHLLSSAPHLSVREIAALAHRSPAAFHDTYGTLGRAVADLALVEQVARIPAEVFEPCSGPGAPHVVEHVARRLVAWHASQGDIGRRLLQMGGLYPEVAAVLAGQTLDSVERLMSWCGDPLDWPRGIARLVFGLLLLTHRHQVVWGSQPDSIGGPLALAELFAPLHSPMP